MKDYPPCLSLWCGKCYFSNNDFIKFHIKEKEGFDDVERSDEDIERLQSAWGNRHRPVEQYLHGRDGDHLMTPFECDLCIFRKLRGASPDVRSIVDNRLLACIRRINLDAFWSRSSSTVTGNKDRIIAALKISKSLGLQGPYVHEGPMPDYDYCGYELALQMVEASRRPGKHSKNYTQFETIRKHRAAFSSFSRATPQANKRSIALVGNKGNLQRFVQDSTVTLWFQRFVEGCERRMGNVWKPNEAFSTKLILTILEYAQGRLEDNISINENDRWLVFISYCVITYTLSLRGTEGFYLDLEGLNRFKENVTDRHFVIPLLGQVKGEHHDRCHLFPCVKETSSGIKVFYWIDCLRQHKENLGFKDGSSISDLKGKVLSCSNIDDSLHEILGDIWRACPDLFPDSMKKIEEIRERYQAFRSFRRASTTRAGEKKVSVHDIDTVNRWHVWDQAAGRKPSLVMRQNYTQYNQQLEPFLRYTYAM